jgi:hypothetical protein
MLKGGDFMIDKNQIIHDLAITYLQTSFDFEGPYDEASFAMYYKQTFEKIKNTLSNFKLE